MPRDPSAGLPTLVGRALRRRCPRCGDPRAFRGYTMVEHCPGCGHRYEREQGYWIGAMIVDTAVTFGLFLLVLVAGMVATWPEVPWTGLLVASFAVNLVVPVAFYPWAKGLWVALELAVHPLEPAEQAAAASRAEAATRPTAP